MKGVVSTILLVGFVAFAAETSGRSKAPAEAVGLHTLSSAFGLFHSQYGRYPTNWPEVYGQADLLSVNRVLKGSDGAFPLEAFYVFIPRELDLRRRDKSRILMLRVSPVQADPREEKYGRYAIVHAENGAASVWVSESEVSRILESTGAELPAPDLAAARIMEQKVLDAQAFLDQMSGGTEAVGLRLAMEDLWRKRSKAGVGFLVIIGVVIGGCFIVVVLARKRRRNARQEPRKGSP